MCPMTGDADPEPARVTPTGSAAVGYLFGTIGARAMPGTVAVPLLADLGMSVSAARTLLHRMRVAGSLATERVGRIAVYRLAGRYLQQYQQIAFGALVPGWSGAFEAIIYHIPEGRRAQRDQLREQAFAAGFAAPRSGLLIGVSDPDPWAISWLSRDDIAVDRVRLGCDLDTARRLADRAWRLAELAAQVDDFAAALHVIRRQASGRRMTNQNALVRLYQVWRQYAYIQIQLPCLPLELYPDRWSLPNALKVMNQINDELLPLARRHVQSVIDLARAADLIELDPRPRRGQQGSH